MTDQDNAAGTLTVMTSKLVDFTGLENLTKVSRLRIEGSENLLTLEGLNGLVEITGDNSGHNMLWIRYNPTLQNLNGLESLRTIGKEDYHTNVSISGNPSLQNIDGLQKLTTIGGPDSQNGWNSPSLKIVGNESLTHINGLSSLNFVKGYIKFLFSHDMIGPEGPQVYGNINLTDFCGLQNLLVNGSYEGLISVSTYYDGFGPSAQDIIDGNCSQ